MSAEKYALLEARIRQTASLVGQLREENQQLVEENERLRQRVAALEKEVRRGRQPEAESGQDLDQLLAQLDTLHQTEPPSPTIESADTVESEPAANAPPAEEEEPRGVTSAQEEGPRRDTTTEEEGPHGEAPQTAEEYFQLGKTYERRGQFEPAVQIYQQLLEADNNNLEVAQRLAFLLEKLNREEEAAPLWDRIWRMRAGRSRRQRWSR